MRWPPPLLPPNNTQKTMSNNQGRPEREWLGKGRIALGLLDGKPLPDALAKPDRWDYA